MNWLPYFRAEIEKQGFAGALVMGGLNAMDAIGSAKQKINEVKMVPLRQQAQQLQLPGSNQMQFEGSKRIDSGANNLPQ